MHLPLTFHDEFGYLANAAFMTGYDWSAAMWNVPYYAIGFSFWLIPAYLISPDYQWIYQFALTLNGLFHALAFLVSIKVLRNVFPRVSSGVLVTAGVLVAFYPAFQVYEKMALGESLLLFMVWVVAWALQWVMRSGERQKGFAPYAILGLVAGYAYIVHGRAIVLVVAAGIFVLARAWRRQAGVSGIAAFLTALFVTVIGFGLVKSGVVSELYASPSYNQHELASLASDRLSEVMTAEGVIRFAKLVGGQFGYLCTSSYGLVPLGVFLSIGTIWSSFSASMRKSKGSLSFAQARAYADPVTLMYALLVVVGGLAITALFTSSPSRLDNYFYGRYTEPFAAPLMSFGAVFLLSLCWGRMTRLAAYGASFAVGIAVTIAVWKSIDVVPARAINWAQITGWFPYRTSQWGIDVWRVMEETSVAAVLIAIGTVTHRYIALALIAVIFWNVSSENLEDQLRRGKFGIQADLAIVREAASSLATADRICFHSGVGGSYGMTKDAIQLMLPAMKLVGFKDWPQVEELDCGAVIVNDRFNAMVSGDWHFIGTGGRGVNLWLSPALHAANKRPNATQNVSPPPEDERVLIEMLSGSSPTKVHRFVAWYGKYRMLPGRFLLPSVDVSVRNVGTFAIPGGAQLGVFITRPGERRWVGEYRVDLPERLEVGESLSMEVPIYLQSGSGELLPRGRYVIHVAPFDREGWHFGSKVEKIVQFQ